MEGVAVQRDPGPEGAGGGGVLGGEGNGMSGHGTSMREWRYGQNIS